MLVWDDKTKGDTNPNPAYSGRSFWKPKIFMFSDLAAGKLKDVFADAGYSIVAGNYGAGDAPMMASLNVGVSTYVYINTTRHDIAVLRFGPSGVNVAPVTPPPGGGGGGGPVVTTTPGSGNPPGPEPTAGSCDFTLTPNPASINKTVAQGQSSYISFGLSTTKPVDTTCPAITLSLSTVRDTAGNTVATPLSTSLTISPGNSTVAIYNVNKVPGSYTLPIKAYGRGVQKIIDLELIVQ